MATGEEQLTSASSQTRLNTGVALLFSWIATLAVPVALIGLSVRLVLLPVFPQIEYHTPGFPPDDYGFTTQERVHWATVAWNYLVNSSDISYLGNLKFPDGSPLYNERELSHMHDVKGVLAGAFRAWYISIAVLFLLAAWAWRTEHLRAYRRGLSRGGWLTIGVSALIGSIVLIGMLMDPEVFWTFFADFHSLFFKGNSWIFAYSDTLIRLFPIRFWQDTFLAAAAVVLAGGLALAFGLRERRK